MTTLPEQLLNDLEQGVRVQSDIDVFGAVHAIIADVIDSMRLALSDTALSSEERRAVITEVEDYVANHYGED